MLFIRLRLQPLKLAQTRFLSTTGTTGTTVTIGDKTVEANLDPAVWSRLDETRTKWRTTIDTFWKKPLAAESPVVTIASADNISGKFPQDVFVTAERRFTYDRIQHVRRSRAPGVVVTGQPGIGKSSSIPYFMIRELGTGRPLYIMNGAGRVFFVAKEGVWATHSYLVSQDAYPVEMGERLLVLIDSASTLDEPNLAVQEAGVSVFCPSPAIARYKEMLKQGHGLFVMDPWKWDELRQFASHLYPRNSKLPKILDVAPEFCPPTPRALEEFLLSVHMQGGIFDPEKNEVSLAIADAVSQIESGIELDKLISSPTWEGYRPELTDKLFCLRRTLRRFQSTVPMTPTYATRAFRDSSHLDFVSDWAHTQLLRKVPVLHLQTLSNAYNAASLLPNGAVLSGHLYEPLFLNAALSSSPKGVRFGDIYQFEARPIKPDKKFPVFHGYVRGSDVIATKVSNPPNWNDFHELDIYDSLSPEEIVPRPGVLFVPRSRNNSLFDVFVLQKGEHDGAATLWFIQLTISSSHSGKKVRYDLIRTFHTRVLRDFPKADVGYLLICPYDNSMHVWEFDNPGAKAKPWRPEEGRVFVQAFDLEKNFQ